MHPEINVCGVALELATHPALIPLLAGEFLSTKGRLVERIRRPAHRLHYEPVLNQYTFFVRIPAVSCERLEIVSQLGSRYYFTGRIAGEIEISQFRADFAGTNAEISGSEPAVDEGS